MSDEDARRAAQADLAFMRGLVASSPRTQRIIGESFVAAGVIYGLQCVWHATQLVEGWEAGPLATGLIVAAFTVAFTLAMIWVVRRHGPAAATGGGAARTGGAVFGAIGLTNIVLIAIFATVALRERSLTIWLIYPAVVLTQQGAGWLAYYALRRRGWMLGVALAFFACALAMAFTTAPAGYLAVITFALLGVMTGAGLLLIRDAGRDG